MHEKWTLSQRFKDYQASKTVLFWACAGSVAVALVVGFSWGGWVTGGSARETAANAAAQARQELAAVVCADRFLAASNAGVQLTALQQIESSYAQTKFVQDGGWATIMPASSTADRRATAAASADERKTAALCAAALATREAPRAGTAASIDGAASPAQ